MWYNNGSYRVRNRLSLLALGKVLISIGLLTAIVGGIVWALGRSGFAGLPGDIKFSKGNVSFYFPIATCIALSLILSLIMNLMARWRH